MVFGGVLVGAAGYALGAHPVPEFKRGQAEYHAFLVGIDRAPRRRGLGGGAALSAMVKASGDNIGWLMEQGVTFAEVDHVTFHSFSGGFDGAGAQHYARPMEQRARELGVTFLTETLATSFVKDESGAVCGIVAEGADGAEIRISAKAVIAGGGGFVQSKELMKDYFGMDIDSQVSFLGLPGHDGSVIQMALDAGAKSNMGRAGIQGCIQVVGLPTYLEGGHFSGKLENYPFPGIWVNQDCKRFVNEDCGEENWSLPDLATMGNRETYVLLDEPAYAAFVDNLEDQPSRDAIDSEFQEALDKGNCLDNAATEQVFGHLKDEFFRGGQWPDFAGFKRDLEACIVHWNRRRRWKRPRGPALEEFRSQPPVV